MLLKYVNLTSGWRHRLFVLDGGVLRYYKVYGPTAINVFKLMETLRQDGDVFTIGAETPLLEARDKRRVGGGCLAGTPAAGVVVVAGLHSTKLKRPVVVGTAPRLELTPASLYAVYVCVQEAGGGTGAAGPLQEAASCSG